MKVQQSQEQQAVRDAIIFRDNLDVFDQLISSKTKLEIIGAYIQDGLSLGYDLIFSDKERNN